MPTQCNTKPLEFEPHQRCRVAADFDGGPFTSALPPLWHGNTISGDGVYIDRPNRSDSGSFTLERVGPIYPYD